MDIQQHMWISYPRLGNWGGNACPLEVALLPGLGSQAEWKGKSEQSLVTLCFITIEAMWPGAFSSCHLPSPRGVVWATEAPTSLEWASWGVFCHNNKKETKTSSLLLLSAWFSSVTRITLLHDIPRNFSFRKTELLFIKYCSSLNSVQQKAM